MIIYNYDQTNYYEFGDKVTTSIAKSPEDVETTMASGKIVIDRLGDRLTASIVVGIVSADNLTLINGILSDRIIYASIPVVGGTYSGYFIAQPANADTIFFKDGEPFWANVKIELKGRDLIV